jgi:dTDP-4-amino-4,6-dideoxygalactose transaminase
VLNTGGGPCKLRFADPELGDRRFVTERMGFSSKMNEVEAAVGLACLERYDELLQARRRNLFALLKGVAPYGEVLETLSEDEGEELGPHALPLGVREGAPFTRDELAAFLEARGIDTRSLFQSMPTQCPGFRYLGYEAGQFPNAEYIGTHGLHLGVHQGVSEDDVAYVLECLGEFIGQHG